jgi:aconitate hydratase
MGILPLQFLPGQSAATLGLTGEEEYDIAASGAAAIGSRDINVAVRSGNAARTFRALVRIDTPQEALYYKNGGILQFVLRQLLARK